MKKNAANGFLFMLLLLCSGIAMGQTLNGSYADKFIRYQQYQAFAGTSTTSWTDTAWKGDRLYKQIVLWSSSNITGLSYVVSNLVKGGSTISSANIKLRFENYVIGDTGAQACGFYPGTGVARQKVYIADALSETVVTSVSATDPLKLWATVDIPSTAAAGTYTGTIKVKKAGAVLKTFNINILVSNSTLPAVNDWKFNLNIWQFPFNLRDQVQWNGGVNISPFSTQYFSLIKPFYKMLADQGQKRITSYMFDGAFKYGQSMVKWIRNPSGTWSFDFSNFDKYVDSLTSWGMTGYIDCFSVLGWQSGIAYYDSTDLATVSPNSPWPNTITSPGFATTWTSFLTALRTHVTGKGWFERTVLYLDEIPAANMDTVVSLVKAENASWKIGYAGHGLSAATESQVFDYTIFLGYETSVNGTQPTGSMTNYYTSCSNTIPNNYITPVNNPAEMTWCAWHARNMGFAGFLRWAYDYWTNADVTNMQDGGNTAGDFEMIYRSDNSPSSQPLSSIRMELLRDGIQDFEKIAIVGSSYAPLANIVGQCNGTSGNNALGLMRAGQSQLKRMAALLVPGAVPVISSFSPSSGGLGSIVTIKGSNFLQVNKVLIGGVPVSSFSVLSPDSITAVVGAGATGKIALITATDTVLSANTFTITQGASYCSVSGGAYQAYYIQAVTTTGATTNLNFAAMGWPVNGYIFHTASALNTTTGSSFAVNLTNSSASNCARTTAWIDWNGDGDFDDSSEVVFNGGTFQSCANPTSYPFSVNVPSNATAGTTRMRVQIRDAWLGAPVSCGSNNFTGSADFIINIQDPSLASGEQPSRFKQLLKKILKWRKGFSANEIFVDIPDGIKIKAAALYSASGQLCMKINPATDSRVMRLNMSGLAQGIYFLKVESDTYQVATLQIMK